MPFIDDNRRFTNNLQYTCNMIVNIYLPIYLHKHIYVLTQTSSTHAAFSWQQNKFFGARNWSHIASHLVVVGLLLTFVGSMLFKKNLRLSHFKSDWDKIWQNCSASKCASSEGIGLFIWHYTFEMIAMTSLHQWGSADEHLPVAHHRCNDVTWTWQLTMCMRKK